MVSTEKVKTNRKYLKNEKRLCNRFYDQVGKENFYVQFYDRMLVNKQLNTEEAQNRMN